MMQSPFPKPTLLSPKSFFYQNNGTGRDSYISSNNEGFFPSMSTQHLALASPKRLPVLISPKPTYTVGMQHYVPDGTGRDTYIKLYEGGFNKSDSQNDMRHSFERTLRQHDKIQRIDSSNGSRSPDFFRLSQFKLPKLEMKKLNKIHKEQTVHINKLATPKYIYSKDTHE